MYSLKDIYWPDIQDMEEAKKTGVLYWNHTIQVKEVDI